MWEKFKNKKQIPDAANEILKLNLKNKDMTFKCREMNWENKFNLQEKIGI